MKKNSFGFTLIELLVAITIGLLVVGFGTVAINNFYQNQKVETTSQELLSDLILARNYAITNQFPPNSTRDTDRVSAVINTEGLMTIGTQTSGNVDTGYTFFSNDITPNDVVVTILSSFGNGVVKFSVTDGRSIGGSASIIINNGSATKNIKIDESGLIYEQ